MKPHPHLSRRYLTGVASALHGFALLCFRSIYRVLRPYCELVRWRSTGDPLAIRWPDPFMLVRLAMLEHGRGRVGLPGGD